MKMTVGRLREFLNEVLERLEDFEEADELSLQGNTYFTRDHSYVLQTPEGFIGLDYFDDAIIGDDDEYEDNEEGE